MLQGELEGKLTGSEKILEEISWESETSDHDRSTVIETIRIGTPARYGILSTQNLGEEKRFPRSTDLESPIARANALHFFANHELLAIESMAWVLFRFPDAPLEFRQGVWRTLQEEQQHLLLYRNRMKTLGLEFGELGFNFYFWNVMRDIQTPIDFVTRMSLTFEQANLDFALSYANQMKRVGDLETFELLTKIHHDEIRHVRHGLKWFRHWGDGNPDWERYRKILSFPLNPRRGRGSEFSAESRSDVGFDPNFIDEMEVAGGSRGKSPRWFLFNPECDLEEEGQSRPLSSSLFEKISDLEPLSLWMAEESDRVELNSMPPMSWLKQVHHWKGSLAERFLSSEVDEVFVSQMNHDRVVPWGWGQRAWERLEGFRGRVKNIPNFQKATARNWLSKKYWSEWVGSDLIPPAFQIPKLILQKGELLSRNDPRLSPLRELSPRFLFKANQGTSGRGHLIWNPEEGDFVSKRDGVIEPFLDRISDFSVQIEVGDSVRIGHPREFTVDSNFRYRGTLLNAPPSANMKLIPEKELFPIYQAIADHLIQRGYRGNVGVDGLVYSTPNGARVYPVVEVNVRSTMGQVAQQLEKILNRNRITAPTEWRWVSIAEVRRLGFQNFDEYHQHLEAQYGNDRVIATTPSLVARGIWTVLVISSRRTGDEHHHSH